MLNEYGLEQHKEEWIDGFCRTFSGRDCMDQLRKYFSSHEYYNDIKDVVLFSCYEAAHFYPERDPFFSMMKNGKYFIQEKDSHLICLDKIIKFIEKNIDKDVSPEYVEISGKIFLEKIKTSISKNELHENTLAVIGQSKLFAIDYFLLLLKCYRDSVDFNGNYSVYNQENFHIYGCIQYPCSINNRKNKPTPKAMLCLYLVCLFRNLSIGRLFNGLCAFPTTGRQKPRHSLAQSIVSAVFPPSESSYDDSWAKTTEARFLRDNPDAKISVDWTCQPTLQDNLEATINTDWTLDLSVDL